MKRIVIALAALVISVGLGIESAEAKRLGGGKSFGAQRSVDTPKQAPTAAPAQQAAPGTPAAAAQQRPGMGRWLAPLAGLAAGLGLAALFGDELAPFIGALLVGLLIAAVIVVLMRVFGRRAPPQASQLQYAGLGRETVSAPPPSQAVPAGSLQSAPLAAPSRIPAGFDAPGFVKQAKRSFLDLQAANDTGDVAAIRDFTTDEMFELLKQDIEARGPSGQRTDVMTLDADLLEVVTDGGMHWASVRFSGMIREAQNDVPQSFEEVWNLQKPVDGSAGWMLAGIQQVQ